MPHFSRAIGTPGAGMNPPLRALSGERLHWARKSMELDFRDVDRIDEDTLNRILWHSVKGDGARYPGRRRMTSDE